MSIAEVIIALTFLSLTHALAFSFGQSHELKRLKEEDES